MTDSLLQLKGRLRRKLVMFRIYNFLSEARDVLLGWIALVLTFIFHAVFSLEVVVFQGLCNLLDWHTGFELVEALIRYHDFCMDEISKRATSISELAASLEIEANGIKRAAKALLSDSGPVPFSASSCDIIIQKIRLTRKGKKALGADVSAFFMFILRFVTFMA